MEPNTVEFERALRIEADRHRDEYRRRAFQTEAVLKKVEEERDYWKQQQELTKEEFKDLKLLKEEFKIPGNTYTQSIREFIVKLIEERDSIKNKYDQLIPLIPELESFGEGG